MKMRFACSNCGKSLMLDEEYVGKHVQCPFCSNVFLFSGGDVERPLMATPYAGVAAVPEQYGTNWQTGASSRQSVVADVTPVGFWARVAASIIDSIVLLVLNFVIGIVLGMMLAASGAVPASELGFQVLGNAIGLIVGWIYSASMEASKCQATLGKMAIGAKVFDGNGNRLSFGRATGRYFAKLLSSLIFCIGHLMVAFDERKRGLHDMIADTYVIYR